ncbi:NmrA family NAD(P)-binding protein [Hymenobacter weizhouensis]|uniref:NmrA family NAD(P)-binding protein n=1 Tax=Hymenobacter sp. YIM 151500-1 TaxID=2987689 RepID=UPI002225C7A2|nr:NmrA family NAD(P)-binding protein [Hymenobacter sp. YIM 151500-1]UYZ63212.1 NmrA family NAD(P)-binding protein [Hymenobacter sp. YIM 151500-1]
MKRLLITGATGNVGMEVLRSLAVTPTDDVTVLAGVRDVARVQPQLRELPTVTPVRFDFADASTYEPALRGVTGVFLLLPAGLPDAPRRFGELVAAAQAAGVQHVVYMSVQGAEDMRLIPHHRIEKAVMQGGVPYTLLRPAYFMQNFNSTLRDDLVRRNLIYLPAGQARFTLIDVRDIGRVAAEVLRQPTAHAGQAYTLTGTESLTFGEMAVTLTQGLGRPIRYLSPNPLRFFLTKKRQGTATGFILIMILLHYLARFQRTAPTTDWVQRVTGQAPLTFAEYVRDYRAELS